MTLYKQRERFKGISEKIGKLFAKLPFSANQWTLLSIVPAIAAGMLLAKEHFLSATILFLVSAAIDFIDGSVAREKKTVSKLGAFLDTIVDRYIEGIIIFGALFANIPGLFLPISAWLLLYLFGAMMTTYAKAAAKEKEIIPQGSELKGGLLERAERLLLLALGMLLAQTNPIYFTYVIVILAVLTNVSALQRIMTATKAAEK